MLLHKTVELKVLKKVFDKAQANECRWKKKTNNQVTNKIVNFFIKNKQTNKQNKQQKVSVELDTGESPRDSRFMENQV